MDRGNSNVLSETIQRKYTSRLTELKASMFRWSNLPNTCDKRNLKACLSSVGTFNVLTNKPY